jgi:hypothetical protein
VPRLDSGYASKPKNFASAACGYLQGITVVFCTSQKARSKHVLDEPRKVYCVIPFKSTD